MFPPADLFDLSQTDPTPPSSTAANSLGTPSKKSKLMLNPTFNPTAQKFARLASTIRQKVFINDGFYRHRERRHYKGPAIIAVSCEIRHNAYLRDHVIIGDGCIIGNATELKNSPCSTVFCRPALHRIGDLILGVKASLHLCGRRPLQFQDTHRNHLH